MPSLPPISESPTANKLLTRFREGLADRRFHYTEFACEGFDKECLNEVLDEFRNEGWIVWINRPYNHLDYGMDTIYGVHFFQTPEEEAAYTRARKLDQEKRDREFVRSVIVAVSISTVFFACVIAFYLWG
jgi:hypothetical protein